MNATELFIAAGKPAGIWYCEKCRNAKRTREEAEECCLPKRCPDCGGPSGQTAYSVRCHDCNVLHRARIERERFEKAEKITQWTGPVFSESGERYAENISELLDALAESVDDDEDATVKRLDLEYVWTCNSLPICQLDIDNILENATEACAPEDWDYDDLDGREELEAALEKFSELNKGQISWYPNYKVALLLTPV